MNGAAFWDHTSAIYRKPDVAAACLALQDRRGLDVNFLLFALWRAADGQGPLDRAALALADGRVALWRETVVEQLRAARNAIKAGVAHAPVEPAEALRKAIIGQEIEGERLAHMILAEAPIALVPSTDRAADAAASLLAYAGYKGFAPDSCDRADLRVLLAAAFPETPAAALDRLVGI